MFSPIPMNNNNFTHTSDALQMYLYISVEFRFPNNKLSDLQKYDKQKCILCKEKIVINQRCAFDSICFGAEAYFKYYIYYTLL